MAPPATAQILAEHKHLRTLLAEAEQLAVAVLAGTGEQATRLQGVTREFATALIDHLETQAEGLLPGLSRWGPTRLKQIAAEHEAQRASVEALRRLSLGPEAVELARGVRSFVSMMLEDLRKEAELFRPPVLPVHRPLAG